LGGQLTPSQETVVVGFFGCVEFPTIFATPVGLVEETLTRGMRRGLPVTVQQDIVISADGPHVPFSYRIS
jgi:hypothetical protein